DDCARVSKHPGRTQQINFFTLFDKICLADLPGYGYAAVSKKIRKSWDQLILDYLRGRQNLRRIFLLIDSRHGFKSSDEEIMDILDECAVVYQIVLTKADKSKLSNVNDIKNKIIPHTAAFPEIIITSSEKYIGISEVQKVIATFC
ncbi:MAG: ribosome biogenesis GTP-binding protein YsxC, partial [Alphaproteobacteria bacterium]|nr:ribosome biogenesis GTP-binding protein YsxC [Alphaproteobacteria bacterium]